MDAQREAKRAELFRTMLDGEMASSSRLLKGYIILEAALKRIAKDQSLVKPAQFQSVAAKAITDANAKFPEPPEIPSTGEPSKGEP